MALADKIIVLRDGAIMQTGPTAEIYDKPANVFVARFVGVENVLTGRIEERSGAHVTVRVGEQTLRAAAADIAGPEVAASIRAEAVELYPPSLGARQEATGANRFTAHVVGVRILGPLATVTLDCGFPLKAHVLAHRARAMQLAPGFAVEAKIAAEAIHLMPAGA